MGEIHDNGHIVDPIHAHVQIYSKIVQMYILHVTGITRLLNFFISNNRVT